MMATATQHSDATWKSFSESGSCPNAFVSVTVSWKPSSACAPGRMTRASVSICSIFVVSGVGFSSCMALFRFFVRRLKPRLYQKHPGQQAERAPGHEGGRHAEYMIKNDVKAQPQADGKRQQCHAGKHPGYA